ncbi:hypothetical protein [Nocardioides sp. R-C-SC26]|uniref:hypothetical protein n=1 Tax=Nocardioides sp. R-C-SC26 TaxID=2870414 RepID=UPI001E4D6D70|nr:hypothetical protein [Nocardioides sp. R-C-SC26]
MSESPSREQREERLRRLLAQARHDDPMPDDVASRLDRVLERLAAEEPPRDEHDVVELAARRRQRVTALLVAAAAVVVVGVGVGSAVRPDSDSADVASATGGAPEEEVANAESFASDSTARSDLGDTTPKTDEDGAGDSGGGSSSYSAEDPSALSAPQTAPDGSSSLQGGPTAGTTSSGSSGRVVRLTRATFTLKVRRLAGRVPSDVARSRGTTPSSPDFVCAGAPWGPGVLVAALYGDIPTVLALRPTTGRTRTVELLQCGSGAVLRSLVVPVDGG